MGDKAESEAFVSLDPSSPAVEATSGSVSSHSSDRSHSSPSHGYGHGSGGRRRNRSWQGNRRGFQGRGGGRGHYRGRGRWGGQGGNRGGNRDKPPRLLSLAQFSRDNKDYQDLPKEELQTKYNSYRASFYMKHGQIFFKAHSNEDWFQQKYNPTFKAKQQEERNSIATYSKRLASFKEMCEGSDWSNDFFNANLSAAATVNKKNTQDKEDKDDQDNDENSSTEQSMETSDNNDKINPAKNDEDTETNTNSDDNQDGSTIKYKTKMDIEAEERSKAEDRKREAEDDWRTSQRALYHCLCASNVPSWTKADDLASEFQKFDGFDHLIVGQPHPYKKFSRTLYVFFKDAESASQAFPSFHDGISIQVPDRRQVRGQNTNKNKNDLTVNDVLHPTRTSKYKLYFRFNKVTRPIAFKDFPPATALASNRIKRDLKLGKKLILDLNAARCIDFDQAEFLFQKIAQLENDQDYHQTCKQLMELNDINDLLKQGDKNGSEGNHNNSSNDSNNNDNTDNDDDVDDDDDDDAMAVDTKDNVESKEDLNKQKKEQTEAELLALNICQHYLRSVHLFCYYCGVEYETPQRLFESCGLIHLRTCQSRNSASKQNNNNNNNNHNKPGITGNESSADNKSNTNIAANESTVQNSSDKASTTDDAAADLEMSDDKSPNKTNAGDQQQNTDDDNDTTATNDDDTAKAGTAIDDKTASASSSSSTKTKKEIKHDDETTLDQKWFHDLEQRIQRHCGECTQLPLQQETEHGEGGEETRQDNTAAERETQQAENAKANQVKNNGNGQNEQKIQLNIQFSAKYRAKLEQFFAQNSKEYRADKHKCLIEGCGKAFRAPEFLKKHMRNRHSKLLQDIKVRVKEEQDLDDYYNSFCEDESDPWTVLKLKGGYSSPNNSGGNRSKRKRYRDDTDVDGDDNNDDFNGKRRRIQRRGSGMGRGGSFASRRSSSSSSSFHSSRRAGAHRSAGMFVAPPPPPPPPPSG